MRVSHFCLAWVAHSSRALCGLSGDFESLESRLPHPRRDLCDRVGYVDSNVLTDRPACSSPLPARRSTRSHAHARYKETIPSAAPKIPQRDSRQQKSRAPAPAHRRPAERQSKFGCRNSSQPSSDQCKAGEPGNELRRGVMVSVIRWGEKSRSPDGMLYARVAPPLSRSVRQGGISTPPRKC